MTNKKYLPSVIVLYLNYFLHGIGCSILGQVAIKEALSASWNVEVMAITAISAALGFGRLIALPFAGPLSDKLGRRFSTAIGGFAYAAYLIGLALAFNMGGGTGYKVAYVCAVIGGIANSFLDTGIYPAVGEIIDKAPGVATIGIKFAISGSQLLLPFFLAYSMFFLFIHMLSPTSICQYHILPFLYALISAIFFASCTVRLAIPYSFIFS